MSFLVTLHQKLGTALIVVLLAGALGALVMGRRDRSLPALRAYVWLCTAALAVQALLGLLLLTTGDHPHDGLHYLYGAVTVLALPMVVAYGRTIAAREALILALGLGAGFLLALRALLTG